MRHLANSFTLIDPYEKRIEAISIILIIINYYYYYETCFFSNKMTISRSPDDIRKEQRKYSRVPSRSNPMEFIRSSKSGRENYDRLECNWRGGPTLPLNALSAVF